MLKHTHLAHKFVRSIPKQLEPGILYVSMEYATAIHSCCCGCGNQVVTPITPTDWQLMFDGDSISLSPSIGNWGFKCRSHYFIRKGMIVEAGQWDKKTITAGRDNDKHNKAHYYQAKPKGDDNTYSHRVGLFKRVWHWFWGNVNLLRSVE